MWFTEPAANRIERVGPSGQAEGFAVPTAGSLPTGIVDAPGGFLWVTMEGTGKVAKVDPIGHVVESALNDGARPAADGAIFKGTLNSDIVTGPDGNLWLSQEDGPFVGTVIPSQTRPEYVRFEDVPEEEDGGTTLISKGPRGSWYATERGAIGSIAPNGEGIRRPRVPAEELKSIGRYHPSPLFLAEHGPLKAVGSKLKVPLECRGAAGRPPALQGHLRDLPRQVRRRARPLRDPDDDPPQGDPAPGRRGRLLRGARLTPGTLCYLAPSRDPRGPRFLRDEPYQKRKKAS